MKWFIVFFAILVGITTSDLIGLSPDMWQYWLNAFTISFIGSVGPFIEDWTK